MKVPVILAALSCIFGSYSMTDGRWQRETGFMDGFGSMLSGFISGIVKGSSGDEENHDRQGFVDKNGKLTYCNLNKKDCDFLLCLAENFEHSPQTATFKEGAKVIFDRDMRQALEKDPLISKLACDKVGLDEMGCQGFRSFLGLIDMIDPNKGDPMKPTREPPPDNGPGIRGLLGGGAIPFVGSILGGGGAGNTETTTVAVTWISAAPAPSAIIRTVTTRSVATVATAAPTPAPVPNLGAVLSAVGVSTSVNVPVVSGSHHRLRREASPTTKSPPRLPNGSALGSKSMSPSTTRPLPHRPRGSGSGSGSGNKGHGTIDYSEFYEYGGAAGSGTGHREIEPTVWKERNCQAEFLGIADDPED